MSGPLDALSERGERMVEALSVPEQDDPAVIALMRAGADELDSAQATAEAIRFQAWPQQADDTYGILSLHESMLGLPVGSDTGLAQRRAAVRAAIQSRKVGSKSNWRARLTMLLRGLEWTYEEDTPGPGELTINIPYQPTSYTAAQALALAERITPAHLVIHVLHFISDFTPDYAYIADNFSDYAEVASSYGDYADLAGTPG